jgi:hypothetical protein
VRSIEPVDLAAVLLSSVEHAGYEYVLSPPITVQPASQIAFLWDEYAVAKEPELSEGAIELHRVLLGRLKRR